MVQSLRSDNVTYLYSAPHGFFYDKGQGDVARMLNYAGPIFRMFCWPIRTTTRFPAAIS